MMTVSAKLHHPTRDPFDGVETADRENMLATTTAVGSDPDNSHGYLSRLALASAALDLRNATVLPGSDDERRTRSRPN